MSTSSQTSFTFDGGLQDLLPAKVTQGGSAGSKDFNFGVKIHEVTVYNGLSSVIYIAWDSQVLLDATTPFAAGTGTRKLSGSAGVATAGDMPIAPGQLFRRNIHSQHVYLYLPAAAVVNDTAAGCVFLMGARGGVRLDY